MNLKAARMPKEKIITPESVGETYLMLHNQKRGAWTFDLDLRPWGDSAWWNSDGTPVLEEGQRLLEGKN